MRIWAWLGALAILLVAPLGWAATRQEAVLIAVAKTQPPHLEANRPVTWADGPAAPPTGARPPDIVLILADDMGYNDITFNGGGIAGGRVPTANIESIGRDGVSFSNGYDGSSTCALSRASIMTGRYAQHFGFEFTPAGIPFEKVVGASYDQDDFVRPQFFGHKVKDMPPGTTRGAGTDGLSLPPSEIFIAKRLKTRGYRTLHLGRWRLGAAKGARPEQRGFDESLGFMAGGSMHLPPNDPGVENAKQPWDPIDRVLWSSPPYQVQVIGSPMFAPKGYMSDYLTDEAIKAIDANRNRPFFMYFTPNAIHTPFQATKADDDALPQIKDHRLRVYGSMMRNLDHTVGRLLQTSTADGLDKNTLVIFTRDNGAANFIGLRDVNKPYGGFKGAFFEGGVHAPDFTRWPGVIKAAFAYPYPVAQVDIYASAAAVAGAKLPADRKVDGADLLAYLSGKAAGRPQQTLSWRSGLYKTFVDSDWKPPSSEALRKVWLYDLANDPTKQRNLAGAQPENPRRCWTSSRPGKEKWSNPCGRPCCAARSLWTTPPVRSRRRGRNTSSWTTDRGEA